MAIPQGGAGARRSTPPTRGSAWPSPPGLLVSAPTRLPHPDARLPWRDSQRARPSKTRCLTVPLGSQWLFVAGGQVPERGPPSSGWNRMLGFNEDSPGIIVLHEISEL